MPLRKCKGTKWLHDWSDWEFTYPSSRLFQKRYCNRCSVIDQRRTTSKFNGPVR